MPGTSANVKTGAGELFVAPIGTTEPIDATTALPVAWRTVGYTEAGVTIGYSISNEGLFVAEEFDAIQYATTAREGSIALQLAEITRANLLLALNMGAAGVNDITAVEPPAPGTEVRVMAAFNAATGARWLFRQLFSASALELLRAKSPTKALIPLTFRMEKPTGLQPFKVFPAAGGIV